MRGILEHVLKLNEEDRGVGLHPLLKEFIYDMNIKPEEAESRKKKITGYYQKILSTSKNIYVAYSRTHKWALTIFK